MIPILLPGLMEQIPISPQVAGPPVSTCTLRVTLGMLIVVCLSSEGSCEHDTSGLEHSAAAWSLQEDLQEVDFFPTLVLR